MKSVIKWLLYAAAGVALFYGGAVVSMRMSDDATPSISTDVSTQVRPDRAALGSDYEPPAPEDTPCLQPEYVSRCIGRSAARTGLMRLAGLQEERMRERGRYAEEAGALGFQPDAGMVLRMRAGPDGWTAEYHHTAGRVGCALYDGDIDDPFTTFGGGLPEARGAVACDDPLAAPS